MDIASLAHCLGRWPWPRSGARAVLLVLALASLGACAHDEIDRLYGEADLFVAAGPANERIDPESRLQQYPQYLTREDLTHPGLSHPVRMRIVLRRMEHEMAALLRKKCPAQAYRCAIQELEHLGFTCWESPDHAHCASVRKTRDPSLDYILGGYWPQAWSVAIERSDDSPAIRVHVDPLSFE